ncbi:hypothetical protein K2P97_08615 [bacterium]|nr:hypothetical protein [bacterium]
MKFVTRSVQSENRLAQTNVFKLLDDQLILILRAWGSTDYNQKFIDEVSHYLSSTQADLEVTTPFDYQENLSSLANRTRVSLLLVHDLFYKSENKNEYAVGFEATILFKSKNELAWSSVGRFAIDKVGKHSLNTYLKNGSDLDIETLLPVQLIGVEREIDITSGSIAISENSKIIVSSTYNCNLLLNTEAKSDNNLIDIYPPSGGSYWFSVIGV